MKFLPTAAVCYVFAIRTSKRYIPYYVGKTGVGFIRECFTRRNLAGADRNPGLLNVKGRPIARWRIPGVKKTFGL